MGLTRNKIIILVGDAFLLGISYLAAYWLRFESIPQEEWLLFTNTVVPIVFVKMLIFSYLGLHAGPWRYTGILDLVNLVKGAILGFLLIMTGMVAFYHNVGFSRSVFIIDTVNTIFLVGLFRLSIRVMYSHQLMHGIIEKVAGYRLVNGVSGNARNVLIYGANQRGEMLLRALMSIQGSTSYRVVGMVDDNPNSKGSIIHGIRHVGSASDLDDLAKKYDVSELMIASDPGEEIIRRLFRICQKNNISCRMMPPYLDIIHQRFGVSQLKDIEIDDLLRRDTVKIDYSKVGSMVSGKRVLVTGAAGSIGKQLCLQILEFGPTELVCIDYGENELFFLGQEIRSLAPDAACFYYCSDVTNKQKMGKLFSHHSPQIVFHAAAHKHVPLMEKNIDEVIFNNICGVKTIADAADRYEVQTFVFISSDKAVEPANVMGATKRMGELYTHYLSGKSKTRYLSVRFGNVLGSNGSVVPIFSKQIKKGGPVQITHQDATRYFMTIPEAVLLILQSTLQGEQGNIMILDMGKPVKIIELAEEMIRLAGFSPNKEIKIDITGLRPGEKLHEELWGSTEELIPTFHPKISVVKGSGGEIGEIDGFIDELLAESYKNPETAYAMLKEKLSPAVDAKVKAD